MANFLLLSFILLIVFPINTSVVKFRNEKKVKEVRNLSKVIYEDLSSKLTHLMNKRAKMFPGARNLSSDKIDVMKTIDVHSPNPLYGYFWNKGKFESYYHTPHFRGMKNKPKMLPVLHERYKKRKINPEQMQCILNIKIGKMRWSQVMIFNQVKIVFSSNCKEDTFTKYFIIKNYSTIYTLNLEVEGGSTYKIKYYRSYGSDNKGYYFNLYKLTNYYTAKIYKLPDEKKYKLWPHLKPKKTTSTSTSTSTNNTTGRVLSEIRNHKRRNYYKKRNYYKRRRNLRKKNQKRKLAPADLESLIPGYVSPVGKANSSAGWNAYDGLNWKVAGEEFEILAPNGSTFWEYNVINRIWNGVNPDQGCTFISTDYTMLAKV